MSIPQRTAKPLFNSHIEIEVVVLQKLLVFPHQHYFYFWWIGRSSHKNITIHKTYGFICWYIYVLGNTQSSSLKTIQRGIVSPRQKLHSDILQIWFWWPLQYFHLVQGITVLITPLLVFLTWTYNHAIPLIWQFNPLCILYLYLGLYNWDVYDHVTTSSSPYSCFTNYQASWSKYKTTPNMKNIGPYASTIWLLWCGAITME